MLTTCPALWVWPPGSRQPSSCSLATQCDLTTSAAAPGQQVWGKGSVVHLLHHQARRTQPVLHSDFVLLGSREVDKFFPCFLGFHAGSAVDPAADQGGRLPCFLGWRGTCEGGLWSSFLPGSGGEPALYGVGGGWQLLQAQKFRDVWDVPVFWGLPPSLPGLRVRDACFPKRTSDASGSGLTWRNVQCL